METCFFCSCNPTNPASSVELPIYKLTGYNHLLVARRFKYEIQLVLVPRCAGCALVHAKVKKIQKTAIIAGAAIGFVLGVPTVGGAGITAVIGGFIGHWASKSRAKKLYRQQQAKALKQAILESYPPVTVLLQEGWKLEKPRGIYIPQNFSHLTQKKINLMKKHFFLGTICAGIIIHYSVFFAQFSVGKVTPNR